MCVTETARAAPAIAGSDPRIDERFGRRLDSSENTHSQSKPQEAITALRRDFAAEALRVASIKAVHAADNVLLGDDVGAEREIRLAISHLGAGSAAFLKLQNSIDCLRLSGEDAR